MDDQRLIRISKFLSKHLRHTPQNIGLTLEPGGWVSVESLLDACQKHNFPVSKIELDEVVAKNSKQRFAFDPTGDRIRASQGHSVEVDLQLSPQDPPAVLYHGTGHGAVESIQRDGINRMSRHHVHLSADLQTAITVGRRHGKPVVFHIDAQRMAADGHIFYRSANGVWLVDFVPNSYFLRISES